MSAVPILGSCIYRPDGADEAARVVGRKGLLYKEPATRLALCAVHRALGWPDGVRPPVTTVDTTTAVVVSSNLGNVASVVEVARAVHVDGRRGISPLAAPNVSSNVIAGALAIWFGLGGPNVTVCSGAIGGLEAVLIATRLLRAARADRVVVVGTEPGDEVATALYARTPGRTGPLTPGAACVILGRPGTEPAAPHLSAAVAARDHTDPTRDTYGAHGVLQVALAAARVTPGETIHLTCGDPADGWRAVSVTRPDPDPAERSAA
jgi:3-oxoacyl-[acyl-carrier-protein] synthase II